MKVLLSRPAAFTAGLTLLLATLVSAAAADAPRDPLLEPPVINTRPGPEYQDNVRAGAMIIGLDRTPQGRLWGCWTGTGDNSESYFILATSDDGGTTWSRPRVVIDPTDLPGRPPRFSLIGNLWTDPSGRLWLFFDQHMPGFTQTNWYITCDQPDAADPVWSAPVRFAEGSTLNKPTVLRNGDWLLPVSQLAPGRTADSRPGAHVFASTDRGRTWQRRGGVKIPDADTNHNEHMIVERRDGRLWMLLRTRYGLAEAHSSDGGRTWTEPQKSPIENPSTRFFLRRLASGRLLLVKNGPIEKRLPGRTHLTAFLSEDDGQTWGNGLLLDERNALSYPDGFESPDGLIHILYDWNRHTDAEILLAKFREADVRAGRPVSRDASFRHTVDKARAPQLSRSNQPDRTRLAAAAADAKADLGTVAFDGPAAGWPVADALLRPERGGAWTLHITAADGDVSRGWVGVSRSADAGRSWSTPKRLAPATAQGDALPDIGLVEIAPGGDRDALFFSAPRPGSSAPWRAWHAPGGASPGTWSAPAPLPGPLAGRTSLRNPLIAGAGRILVPFQHYDSGDDDPRCGVLASADGGKTWQPHGAIRLRPVRCAFDWTEASLVALSGSRVVMLIRQPRLMGLLYVAESADGGETWPATATLIRAPTGGTATFFSLGSDAVAMVHNPNNKLALWISFDGLKTWPYQRALPGTSCPGPKEAMSHPHGFVSPDRQWLHFAYVDAAHRAAVYRARLPAVP